MRYKIGKLNNLKDDDPEFKHLPEAVTHVLARATDDELWGIWTGQDYGSELLCIIYQDDVFQK